MSGIKKLEELFELEQWLSKFKPKPFGEYERALTCPICEKPQKLWVNIQKRMATCYYCEQGYGVLDLILLLEDCDLKRGIIILRENAREEKPKTFRESVEGVLKARVVEDDEDDTPPPVLKLPDGFVSYESAWPKVPRYFKERGISRQRAARYGLGFCTSGFYFNRLVVPIYQGGKLRGFHPRWMKKTPPPDVKKVQYPPGMKSNKLLFNYDVAKKQKRIVIVEDPFSSMAVGREGTATFGTKLSRYQLRMLLEAEAEEICVLWDRDALDKAYEVADVIRESGKRASVAVLPDERDPDDLPRADLDRVLSAVRAPTLAGRLAARFEARRKVRPRRAAVRSAVR